MCSQDTSAFSWNCSLNDSDNGQKASYQAGPPESVQTSSPSMEKTLEDLNNNNVLNPTTYSTDQSLEEAIKKARENFATLTSIKDSRTVKLPTYLTLSFVTLYQRYSLYVPEISMCASLLKCVNILPPALTFYTYTE